MGTTWIAIIKGPLLKLLWSRLKRIVVMLLLSTLGLNKEKQSYVIGKSFSLVEKILVCFYKS